MRLIKFPLSSFLILFVFVVTPFASASAEVVEGIVAVVDDSIIMRSELDQRMIDLGVTTQNVQAVSQVLRFMVEAIVVEKSYAAMGFPPVTPEQIMEFAARANLGYEDARNLIMRQALMNMMVSSRVVITDRMIENYYADHGEYSGEESLKLKQLVIMNDVEKAREVGQLLAEGQDFDEVALAKADHLFGGGTDIGWVAVTDLAPATRSALAEATAGDTVGPIAVNEYYFFFRVEVREVTGQQAIEDVRDEIISILEERYRQEAFEHWLSTIMADHFIGVYL